ncbi:DegT/DnrJ/EryC1/StrS family aminotransferase [Albimonas pacifica]|uniref:dTDP-4-amino-4,6-dideoxygalactose transaminase n=1 Tax=Albimonas pacifica TaxID=1114924 RepID=A0A1I3PSA2_9RHOB|nr:DegT/DnrJ/EryC1/StrS family aminotransferase [Albimonas pacifica]SFJ24295.1 dTDP-4-amino-4,6-dideoxygalactose transaminase [Albimonas pacifica]
MSDLDATIVIGAGGFLGSHLVEAFEQDPRRPLLAVDRRPPEAWSRSPTGPATRVLALPAGEAEALAALEAAAGAGDRAGDRGAGWEVCIHAAGPPEGLRGPADCQRALAGLAALLEALEGRVRRFVLISSAEVYGAPVGDLVNEAHPLDVSSPQGLYRAGAEQMLRHWQARAGIPCVVLRPAEIFGGRMPPEALVARAIEAARRGAPMDPPPPADRRVDFVHVSDVVEAVRLCLDAAMGPERFEAFNVSSGRAFSGAELAEVLGGFLGRPEAEAAPVPAPRPATGAIGADHAFRRLGWLPVHDLVSGLEEVFAAPAPRLPPLRDKVPLCRPAIFPEDVDRMVRQLQGVSVGAGPAVPELERLAASFLGGDYACAAVNSCASALEAALEVLPRRGEVITSAYSYHATANAIHAAGCTPVFADIERDTFGMDPEAVRALVGERTVAILPVYLFGRIGRVEALRRIADAHGLPLIADAAQAWGSYHRSARRRPVEDALCFSFYPTKVVTTGEGGILAARDPAFLGAARALIQHGTPVAAPAPGEGPPRHWRRRQERFGHGFRMPGPSAALGASQLQATDPVLDDRRRIVGRYHERLDPRFFEAADADPEGLTCANVPISLLRPGLDRERFLVEMNARELMVSAHYDIPVPDQPVYPPAPGAWPVASDVTARVLSWPYAYAMPEGLIARICDAANAVAAQLAEAGMRRRA